jgi:hypothetical protein
LVVVVVVVVVVVSWLWRVVVGDCGCCDPHTPTPNPNPTPTHTTPPPPRARKEQKIGGEGKRYLAELEKRKLSWAVVGEDVLDPLALDEATQARIPHAQRRQQRKSLGYNDVRRRPELKIRHDLLHENIQHHAFVLDSNRLVQSTVPVEKWCGRERGDVNKRCGLSSIPIDSSTVTAVKGCGQEEKGVVEK